MPQLRLCGFILFLMCGLCCQIHAATAPIVLYTDIVSGPTSGGENNQGAYLSIFGKNFGSSGLGTSVRVRINGVEVGRYRSLGVSKGRADIQQITVQVGALGAPTPGHALPITVTVDGVSSNADLTFTPNPGRFLYVDNVAGNDATAVIGDVTHPFRYVQTAALYTGGAWEKIQPGDFIIMRGHGAAQPWVDLGSEHYFMRFRNKSGSAPTGAAGTGPIVVMGYPGEDVYLRGTVANGMTGGCISAINGETYPGMGQWAVVTNLRIDAEGWDGPVSQEIHGHHWRVVNNDLSASTAPRTGSQAPKMAGITGNGDSSFWVGNTIHDIQGNFGECHGVYIDGDGSYEIAWNHIHDIRDGNGFQSYVNGGNGSNVTNNISLHHNLIHNVSKHGINIADQTGNNVTVWNNVVYNVTYAAVRFNTTILSGAKIYNNTFYNTNQAGSPNYGALTNDWNLAAGSVDVINNVFAVAAGTPYNAGSNGMPANAGTITRNLWWNGSGSYSIDTSPVHADPKFVAAGSDFHLQATSPAKDVGSATVASLVADDYDAIRARPYGTAIDIGAFEYAPTSGDTTSPTITTAAHGPALVTGTTTTLSVGANDNSGSAGLTYTWVVASWSGSGGNGVTFTPNGTTAAASSTVTLSHAGTYSFTVTVRDAAGNSVTSTTGAVVVGQTTSAVDITEASLTVANTANVTLHASARDQFGEGISGVTIAWSVDAGGVGGTISTAGVYTPATTTAGDATVRAVSGSLSDTATVHVTVGAGSGSGDSGSGGSSSDGGGGGGCGLGGGLALIPGLVMFCRRFSR